MAAAAERGEPEMSRLTAAVTESLKRHIHLALLTYSPKQNNADENEAEVPEDIVQVLQSCFKTPASCRSFTGLPFWQLGNLIEELTARTADNICSNEDRLPKGDTLTRAVLSHLLFFKGMPLEQAIAVGHSSTGSIQRHKRAMDEAFMELVSAELSGGPTDDDRAQAAHVLDGLAPGCVGFVDGMTVPIARPACEQVQNTFYTPHHAMHGCNYLVFVAFNGRIMEVAEMGPGASVSERAAVRRVVGDMKRKGQLQDGEYFVGDAIYNGLTDGIQGLSTAPRLAKAADGLLPAALSQHSLNAEQLSLLRIATARIVTQALMLRVLTDFRGVVENCIAHIKAFSHRLKGGSSRQLFLSSQRESLHKCVLFSAALVARRQRLSQTFPRSDETLYAASAKTSVLGLLLSSVHIIGGHDRTHRRNAFIDDLRWQFKRRRDMKVVQRLALAVFPKREDQPDNYATLASRFSQICDIILKHPSKYQEIAQEGLLWPKRRMISLGCPARRPPTSSAASSSALADLTNKRSVGGTKRKRSARSSTWVVKGPPRLVVERGSVWSPIPELAHPSEEGYLAVLEPCTEPADLQDDPGAWMAWWYHSDGREATVNHDVASAEGGYTTEPSHLFTVINTIDRAHFAETYEQVTQSSVPAIGDEESQLNAYLRLLRGSDDQSVG